MFVRQHLKLSLAACSNLLPQLVMTYLSYCLEDILLQRGEPLRRHSILQSVGPDI